MASVHSSESGVGIRSCHTSDPLLVFAAVKKMAPSSRGPIGPEVPDESPFSAPSPRGVRNLLMHAVPRMRLHSSLSVVQHFFCRLVCFFFFDAELVFLRPCLFQRLVRNLSFLKKTLKVKKIESTSSGARVGIRTGVRETGCAGCKGVLVTGCFFSVHTRSPFAVSITRGTTRFTLVTACHDQIPSQPYGEL